ncbi:carotenoid oxygenase family protein [Plantactinospora soyae]|uniref:Dioxygenase n=1 Tax=Plantactinospora soyae TaxID=1544732 RepID=A0A927R9T5_9ACTN|nr:carotenoid oxygenase family protein [Plantactinospora soyae]MBE1491744.1 carotenoid cleavage dioxygenase [Plantactinospora soyae]
MSSAPGTSPYLLGAFAPLREEATHHRLAVTGRVPEELDGLFTQIGPSPVRPPQHRSAERYPWLLADGLVCGVRVRGGRALWFRNRWIRSRRVARALGTRPAPGPRHFPVDTVNTNIVSHGGLVLALVESGCLPVQLSSTLDSVGYTDLGGQLPRGFSAHPKVDPATGDLHVLAYSPLRTWAEYLVLAPSGRVRTVRRIPLHGRPMLHDIALTPNYVLFFDLPVRFDAVKGLRGGFPYRWRDEHQSRVGVLPRGGGALRWIAIPPCFVYHVVGAEEVSSDRIVVRAIRYARLFDGRTEDPFGRPGTLWEWDLDLAADSAPARQLDERPSEMPRIDPRRQGRAHRFYYAVTATTSRAVRTHAPDGLVKYDLRRRSGEVRRLRPGDATTEAVFVPRPDSAGEDAGWILHFRYDGDRDVSELVVFDAQDFTSPPLATVRLPVRVPVGAHSTWIPATELASTPETGPGHEGPG